VQAISILKYGGLFCFRNIIAEISNIKISVVEISSQSLLTTFLRATFLNYTSRIDTVNRCIRIVISRPEQIVVKD
jgi:hypothetical protein